MMKKIKIIKNRSDIGAGTRGADMGIDAIEIAAINAGSDFFNQYEYVDVPSSNEAVYEKQNTPYALRIGKVREVCETLSNYVKETLLENKFALVISGDHSSALGSISGLKCAYPDKRIGVVWIDAHADLHSPYTTPSGNIHGMPLAAALADDNKECGNNQVTSTTIENWEAMKNIGGISPKIIHNDLVYFGVRSTEQPEDYKIEKFGVKNYRVEEVRYRGIDVCIAETLERLKNTDFIYITFDVDSLDCDLISKGTGTPVSKGFDQYEVIQIIKGILASGKLACLEIVEVNPCLDNKGNAMAETAFEVLNDVTQLIEKIASPIPPKEGLK